MSAPAFTRGPWVRVGDTLVGLNDEPVARMHEETRKRKANAHLIAAAPELYSDAEFLCARVRELENDLAADETARNYYGHVIPALARMESALAKARGEQ